MVLYLDCGPARTAGKAPGPQIKQLTGTSWVWGGAGAVPAGTVAFDGKEVAFALSGLDAKKDYALGFSWWDYDHNDRAESVWASSSSGKTAQLLKATKLPSYSGAGKGPAEITLPVPKTLSGKGELRLMFRQEGGANAVVGEIWLWEADSGTEIRTTVVSAAAPLAAAAPPRKGSAKPQAAAGAGMPVVMTAPKDESKTNVLIVTGVDYPGHKWKLTTPVLAGILAKDKRFEVRVVADPHQLASPLLHKYDVVVLHFMDQDVPSPGPKARANFTKFVQAGGGVVVVHFACGAWQDWSEYVKIAGRVWNPKLRAHDRRGPFTVEITEADHPITKGMKSFETDDELYTCLDGKTPIEVLAQARSKVDKKLYPMGFVLHYGKGRVFNSPLGHDVKAFQFPGVGELFRRGTAWAAKLLPVAPPG